MEFLITLVLIGMLLFFLPYIIAGAMMAVGILGGILAFVMILLQKLFGRR